MFPVWFSLLSYKILKYFCENPLSKRKPSETAQAMVFPFPWDGLKPRMRTAQKKLHIILAVMDEVNSL